MSLSCVDHKRFVLDDGIHTLIYFYKDFKQKKRCSKRFSHIILNKKRFLQMIINKRRFSQIRRVRKNSHEKEEILTDNHR